MVINEIHPKLIFIVGTKQQVYCKKKTKDSVGVLAASLKPECKLQMSPNKVEEYYHISFLQALDKAKINLESLNVKTKINPSFFYIKKSPSTHALRNKNLKHPEILECHRNA